jgi:hypothetical protein
MESRPQSVRVALILLMVNALLWLAFSAFTAAGAHPSFGADSTYRWPAALFALGVAVVLGILSIHLRTPGRLGYRVTVAFLVAIIFMFLFDQFGLADLVVAVITALPLILLIRITRGTCVEAQPRIGKPSDGRVMARRASCASTAR